MLNDINGPVFHCNQEGLTALMISSRSGRTDLTEILLSGENISLDIQSVRDEIVGEQRA